MSDHANRTQSLIVALGALLLEMAHIDGDYDTEEHEAVLSILNRRAGGASRALLEKSIEIREESENLTDLANRLAPRLSEAQKLDVVGMLWEIAYADGLIHRFEMVLTTRVGSLFGLDDALVEKQRAAAEARSDP